MPSDFTFLNQTLDPTEERLESVDPRLVALGDLAEQGQWLDVAGRVQELLAARIYDIRPLSYYFFGAFHEGGLGAIERVLDAVNAALGANFASIGPSKKREHQFDKRLLWLFEKMLEVIEYHELKRSPEWEAWHEALGEGAIERAIASGDRLARTMAGLPTFVESPRVIGSLLLWLRSHAELLSAPPKKKTEPPPPVVEKPKKLPDVRDEAALEADDAALEALQRRVELVVSHKFTLLLSKLKAFETLVGKEDFTKAALVSADVHQVIEDFDPRDYFPELFARFSALFSKHVNALTDQLEQRESPQWKALEQFYRVDPKSFVDG